MAEPSVQLLLFGPPELRLGERVVVLPTRKLLALLAYLALEGPTTRSRLAELLWDRADDRARANLRGELYRLKKTALGSVLEDRGERLALNGISSDIEDFERTVAHGDWAGALKLRRGGLLEGIALQDAIEFETWLALTRERWEERYDEALGASAGGLERDGNADGALETHRQLLARDPLREDSHRAVMRLLVQASEPAQALEHYQRFAAFLEREMGLEASAAMQEFAHAITVGSRHPSNLEPAVPPTPKGLNTPPLVGRESAWAELARERVGLVLIVAEAGVGKTRLATDFAHAKGSLLVVPHRELAAQVGFGGLIEGLRTHFEAGWRPSDLEPIWRTEAARLLPELADGQPVPTTEGTDEARFREGLARTLLSTLQPGGAILMDDLQWADESTLRFLPYLVRRAARANVRVIGTTRPEGLEPGGWLGRAVRELEREGLNQRVQLAPLEEADVLKLVRGLSGSQGGTVFSERLHAATQGNAFYVLETLRALFERGELKADTDDWHTPYDEDTSDYNELRLPRSVLESVRQRFYRLQELPRRVAELLALSGRDLDPGTLERAAQGSSVDILGALETLERTGLVRGATSGYRLAHDLSRAALDEGLSTARRLTLHARLCEVLSHAPNEPGLAAEIARHAEAAGNWSVMRDWNERAAEEALAHHAHAESAQFYARSLEAQAHLAFDPVREASLRCARLFPLGMIGNNTGDHTPKEAELDRLEALAPFVPDLGPKLLMERGFLALYVHGKLTEAEGFFRASGLPKARLNLVDVLRATGRFDEAHSAMLEMIDDGDPFVVYQAALNLVTISLDRSQSLEAERWIERAGTFKGMPNCSRYDFYLDILTINFLSQTGQHALALERAERMASQVSVRLDAQFELDCLFERGVALIHLGRLTEGALTAQRILQHPLGDQGIYRRWASSLLACAEFRSGRLEAALTAALDALEVSRRFGQRFMATFDAIWCGRILIYRGRSAQARTHFEAAMLEAETIGNTVWRAEALRGLGLCDVLENRADRAEARLREALEAVQEQPGANRALFGAHLAFCLLGQGRLDEALEASSAAMEALGPTSLEPPEQVVWVHTQILHALGDDAGASAALESAHAQLEGSSVQPGVQREAYLEAFSFNRDIRAAMNGIWPDLPRLL